MTAGRRLRRALVAVAVAAAVGVLFLRPTPWSGRASAQPPAPPQDSLAAAFLGSVRGADPLLCELAGRTVENRWGQGVRPRSAPSPVLDWAMGEEPIGPAAVPPLLAALGEPDPCARTMAARLLGRLGGPAALEGLTAALGASDPARRQVGALGLGLAGEESALPALVGSLDDAAPDVRATAAWALGEIESPAAIEPLIGALEDESRTVRLSAAWALGNIE